MAVLPIELVLLFVCCVFVGYFRVTLNITNEVCTDDLKDRFSDRFKSFDQRLSRAIEKLVGDLPGRQVINIVLIQ